MKIAITEYLQLNLETENWECRVCGHVIGPASKSYKEGLLVYNRDPREIHPPIIDPEKYRFTFSPDPEWVRILEFCCPGCGTQVETEYAIPGHPPLYDIQPDIQALKAQWEKRKAEGKIETVVGQTVVANQGHKH